jgi:hypothetical protein
MPIYLIIITTLKGILNIAFQYSKANVFEGII